MALAFAYVAVDAADLSSKAWAYPVPLASQSWGPVGARIALGWGLPGCRVWTSNLPLGNASFLIADPEFARLEWP